MKFIKKKNHKKFIRRVLCTFKFQLYYDLHNS